MNSIGPRPQNKTLSPNKRDHYLTLYKVYKVYKVMILPL